ncbi:hypothetical protein BUALT_Bualt09G0073500 [Buddleja alternifolia]|uniref:Uncharacterized protein n=1 Tax=Buddleja alternifolia TaxID=168488 RepID=A0AAV6X8S9_9LAMI|nr:hypothetical protein BUALT_Bualt09G0073500 [Buddleja alternifolia]
MSCSSVELTEPAFSLPNPPILEHTEGTFKPSNPPPEVTELGELHDLGSDTDTDPESIPPLTRVEKKQLAAGDPYYKVTLLKGSAQKSDAKKTSGEKLSTAGKNSKTPVVIPSSPSKEIAVDKSKGKRKKETDDQPCKTADGTAPPPSRSATPQLAPEHSFQPPSEAAPFLPSELGGFLIVSFDHLMSMASPRDLRYMSNLSDMSLLEDFSSSILQASLLGSDMMSRIRAKATSSLETSKKLSEWEKQVLSLTGDLAKERVLRREMSSELENLKKTQADDVEKACQAAREAAIANFPHSIKGLAMMDDNYQRRHTAFLQSSEHQGMLVETALQYYYHGFRSCVRQFVERGRLPSGFDTSFLQESVGLDNAPEPGEEAPACVLAVGIDNNKPSEAQSSTGFTLGNRGIPTFSSSTAMISVDGMLDLAGWSISMPSALSPAPTSPSLSQWATSCRALSWARLALCESPSVGPPDIILMTPFRATAFSFAGTFLPCPP